MSFSSQATEPVDHASAIADGRSQKSWPTSKSTPLFAQYDNYIEHYHDPLQPTKKL